MLVLFATTLVVVKIMVPFLGTLSIRCRIITGIQKGTIILTTTHISSTLNSLSGGYIGILQGTTIGDSKGMLGV